MRIFSHTGQVAAVFLSLFLSSVTCEAVDIPDPKVDKVRMNYSIGYEVGSDLRRQGVEIDPSALLKGVQDGVLAHEPLLTRKEMQEVLADLQKKIVSNQEAKTKQEAEKNLADGMAFLSENGKRDGVVTLPSGLQYKELKKGSGKHPRAGDTVTVHYRGTLIDGSEFDNSSRSGKPVTFRADNVIPGWKEALQLMKQGSKWELFVPPALGYGERRNGRIGPNSTLIFEIELISSNSK